MKTPVRLVALDMDGTLLNAANEISEENKNVIRKACEEGVEVVISTGRPYVGLHEDELVPLGVHYAITANGAAVYRMPEKECIYSNLIDHEIVCPIIRELQKLDIHMNAFVGGFRYGETSELSMIEKLTMPPATREFIRSTTIAVEDLAAYLEEHKLGVEKMTLNFYPLEDGTFKDRERVMQQLDANPQVTYLSGGFANLEITKTGTTKGTGLRVLADTLGISIDETMAVGDTGNDLDIIKTAGIGVAMGNAIEEVKKAADFVTASNEEDGVAYAIRKFAL